MQASAKPESTPFHLTLGCGEKKTRHCDHFKTRSSTSAFFSLFTPLYVLSRLSTSTDETAQAQDIAPASTRERDEETKCTGKKKKRMKMGGARNDTHTYTLVRETRTKKKKKNWRHGRGEDRGSWSMHARPGDECLTWDDDASSTPLPAHSSNCPHTKKGEKKVLGGVGGAGGRLTE